MRTTVLGWLLVALVVATPARPAEVPSPEDVIGHPVGADRKLVPYPEVLDYLRSVALKSIKESNPFPPFPIGFNYPEFTFNLMISFQD